MEEARANPSGHQVKVEYDQTDTQANTVLHIQTTVHIHTHSQLVEGLYNIFCTTSAKFFKPLLSDTHVRRGHSSSLQHSRLNTRPNWRYSSMTWSLIVAG